MAGGLPTTLLGAAGMLPVGGGLALPNGADAPELFAVPGSPRPALQPSAARPASRHPFAIARGHITACTNIALWK